MFFFFFKKPILSKKRKKALDEFREHAIEALEELSKEAKDSLSKEIFAQMASSVRHTPILFYPRKSLREKFFSVGGIVMGSIVKGEHINQIQIIQRGNRLFLRKKDFINLPADHIFDGEKLSMDGIFTLAHEYGHFQKPMLSQFAAAYRLSLEHAEELLADVLSAKLAVKMGYPKEHVMEHFNGREIVYGRVPFKKFILKAIGE